MSESNQNLVSTTDPTSDLFLWKVTLFMLTQAKTPETGRRDRGSIYLSSAFQNRSKELMHHKGKHSGLRIILVLAVLW